MNFSMIAPAWSKLESDSFNLYNGNRKPDLQIGISILAMIFSIYSAGLENLNYFEA